MYKTLLLFSMLLCKAESNWGAAGNNDPSKGNLGFSAFNMTCNEDGSSCQHCFSMAANGKIYLISIEYTADPFKFQVHITEGNNDWNMYFVQEDQYVDSRWCDNANFISRDSTRQEMRFTMCIENRFTGISVPAGCPKPVALVELDAHEYDEKIRGQQMLYCL
ncbi:uncharacterized protein LOC119723255 [Patiria miniata]|uniref:Uncharacterized protein n=1 Tax=Patiria miniata TaxID=46514 RepID=A0A913ZD94_PATMI|nr:uncharacterized protein LOC119723255 [Patiria miniata]